MKPDPLCYGCGGSGRLTKTAECPCTDDDNREPTGDGWIADAYERANR